jgi:hypothetical protein
MNKFQYKRGAGVQDRNIVSLEAKFRALQLVDKEDKTAKEALTIIASEFNLDSKKISWTRYAGSTISRFRAEVANKIGSDDPDALRLVEKFGAATEIKS